MTQKLLTPRSDGKDAELYSAVTNALSVTDAVTVVPANGEPVDLPPALCAVLLVASREFAAGRGVLVFPQDTVLTAQEAARLLGVSRPTMNRILDSGRIASERPASHRRVKLADVVAYQQNMVAQRQKAMTGLLATSSTVQGDVDGFVSTR